MKKLLVAATMLTAAVLPASADIIETGTFTSDHCTGGCGPQTGGFGTITITDHQNGVVDVSISLLNGNTFANGGQGGAFAFNLAGNPTITYSGLSASFDVVNSATNVQNAGIVAMDGFGNFEYGVDGTFNGSNGPSSLSFTLTGTGLSAASFFSELSVNPPGSDPALMALDIFSGTTSNTGIVDLSPVPGPIVGAGLPGLVMALFGMFGLNRFRRKRQMA